MLPAYSHPADGETEEVADRGYDSNTIFFLEKWFSVDCSGNWIGCRMTGSQKTSTEKPTLTEDFFVGSQGLVMPPKIVGGLNQALIAESHVHIQLILTENCSPVVAG